MASTERYVSVCDEPCPVEYRIVGPFDPRHIAGTYSEILRTVVVNRPQELPQHGAPDRISCTE